MKKGNQRKVSVRRVILTVICVLLALILAALIFAYAYMGNLLNMVERVPQSQETLSSSELYELENQTDPIDENFTGPVIDPTDITWATEPAELIDGEHIINILLIGQDRRPGQGRQRSDAMILCTVNTQTKTLTMTSFLRDLYVQIPGYQDNRLNAAYPIGGMELLDKTLEHNFGVRVDGNIEVDFSQFEQIVDLLGGVDIQLTAAEARYINNQLYTGLTEGMNHLNGEEALAYSRIRYIGTDFGRTNRQRTVLSAMVEQSRNLSIGQLNELLSGIMKLITTDMTNNQILDYALSCFPLLRDISVKTQYVPAEGTYQYASIRGMSVILPDLTANRKLLAESIME